MLPKIPYKMSKNKRQTASFRGINYSNVTSEGDIADSKNISARAYPYLTTRKGRERADYLISCKGAMLENITAVTTFMGKFVVVANGELYYGGAPVGKLTPGEKQFAAVNTKLCIMPDKKYLDVQDPYAPVLKDMGAKVYATVAFGVSAGETSTPTDTIRVVCGLEPIAQGDGISVSGKVATFKKSEEIYSGPIGVLGRWDKITVVDGVPVSLAVSLHFCESMGVGDLTMSVYDDSKWLFTFDFKNDKYKSLEKGDKLFLSDGAVYIVDEIVKYADADETFRGVVVRRWSGYWWYGYSSDTIAAYSPYGTTLFNHYGVTVYRSCAIEDDEEKLIDSKIYLNIEDSFEGFVEVDGSVDNSKSVALNKMLKEGVFTGELKTTGWSDDIDLTKALKAGKTIVFDVEGCGSYEAEVETVTAYTITCTEALPSALSGEGLSFASVKIFEKVASTDSTSFTEHFKKGDCVTITGSGSAENDISFVISDLTESALIAASDVFVTTNGSYDVTVERSIPDMDLICESGNRLWGCSKKDNMIYASALGDPTNFFVNSKISTDSFAVAVGSEGKFTACCRYGSDVLFWKETKLHKVIGSYPAEYTIYSYDIEGVQAGCEKSLVVINEVLYYKGIHGVSAFASAPTLISSNFGERYFTDAVAGTDGDSYYLSLKGDDGRSYLFVYETLLGMWILEDDVRVLDFIRNGKDLYMRTEDGKFYRCGASDTETDMEWFVQLTPFYETLEGSKIYSRLLLRVELPRGSYLRVEVRTDGGAWREAGKIIGRSCEVVPIRIPINRCDKFELRFSGKGKCTVLSMMREFYVGGDR